MATSSSWADGLLGQWECYRGQAVCGKVQIPKAKERDPNFFSQPGREGSFGVVPYQAPSRCWFCTGGGS